MRIENEFKFVFSLEADRIIENNVSALDRLYLRQAIVLQEGPKILRARRTESCVQEDECEMQFKMLLPDGTNFESPAVPLSEDEFVLLWESTPVDKQLAKLRHHYRGWEIDTFLDRQKHPQPYFIMAEYELKGSETVVPLVPDWLAPYLIYTVPQGDQNFASSQLCVIPHAQKMLQWIEGQKDGKL